ncbi:MAG: hypothetical protein WCD86_00470 [Ktedonobacteraceae bacterium]
MKRRRRPTCRPPVEGWPSQDVPVGKPWRSVASPPMTDQNEPPPLRLRRPAFVLIRLALAGWMLAALLSLWWQTSWRAPQALLSAVGAAGAFVWARRTPDDAWLILSLDRLLAALLSLSTGLVLPALFVLAEAVRHREGELTAWTRQSG